MVAATAIESCGSSRFSPALKSIPEETSGSIPGDVIVSLKFPAGSSLKENSPLAPESNVRSSELLAFVSVIRAPESVPPLASRTIPEILAEASSLDTSEPLGREPKSQAHLAGH